MSMGRAALLLLAVAGCRGDRIEYHRVEFPGFSLDVPTFVKYGKDQVTEYRAGRAEARNASNLVTLMWRLGTNTPLEEMPMVIRTMSRAMSMASPESMTLQPEPARALQISGNDATQMDARIETSQMSYTEIACGKRVVVVQIVARLGSVRAMRDRILGSFNCQPIAAQEAAIGAAAAPFGIDDPALLAGWHRVNLDDQFAISNGELLVLASQRPRWEHVAKNLDQYLPMMVGASAASWTKGKIETRQIHGGERTFHHGRWTMDGETMDAAVTVWPCPERGDSVLAFAMSEPGGAKLDPAIALLAKLRCARPDDPPLSLAPDPEPAGSPP